MRNIFKELNVNRYSTEDEVKESYYKLVKKNYDEYCEDENVISLAKKRIEKIDEAFELITDIEHFDYFETKYETLYALAEDYKKNKKFEKALLLSNKLINFIPIFPDSYLMKADILADMKRYKDAIKYFELAEEMEEDLRSDQYVQYLKAKSQIGANLYQEAIITLKRIIDLYGDNPFFFYDMACCYQGLGNMNMYKVYCEKRDNYWKEHEND